MTPAVLRFTDFFGGKKNQDVGTFPHKNQFEGKLKKEFKDFWLTRLEWSVDTYIDSLRFTMADGTVSPKFGNRAFTHNCDFTSPVNKVEATYRERGLVSLTFYTDNEELTIQGDGVGKNKSTFELDKGVENIVQFHLKMGEGRIHGINFGIMTTPDILSQLQDWLNYTKS